MYKLEILKFVRFVASVLQWSIAIYTGDRAIIVLGTAGLFFTIIEGVLDLTNIIIEESALTDLWVGHIFRCRAILRKKIFRYKFAGIKLTFFNTQSLETAQEPEVSVFYPCKVYHNAVPKTKSWKFGNRPSMRTASIPSGVHSTDNGGEFILGRRLKIHGMKNSKTVNRDRDNVCRWTIFENRVAKHGIPEFFTYAVIILENGQSFKVNVELKVSASLEIVLDPRSWGLITHLWKDDPLIFNGEAPLTDGLPLPIQVEGSDWSKISDEQRQKLVPFPGEYMSQRTMPLPSPPEPPKSRPTEATSSVYGDSPSSSRSLTHRDYKVGWICALAEEEAAAMAMLDERHDPLPRKQCDDNSYVLGRIGQHNIVITPLPAGEYGTNSAAHVASNMKRSFPLIRFSLMVGIGGGIPSLKHDIRLGDIVVSIPSRQDGGVVQYDFGKKEPGKFVKSGFLNAPALILRTAVTTLRAEHLVGGSRIPEYLSPTTNSRLTPTFTYPHAEPDKLFEANCVHSHGGDICANCDSTKLLNPTPRANANPVIHYGPIGSGNLVIKDAIFRDQLESDYSVLCFEMEAAGLMNILPCIVIRGISDYADSHKQGRWKNYAAATSAAYAKELLRFIPPEQENVEY